ncbi:MAG: SpoIVB peptidase S55 domain-containing protein [Bryobacteraceae bacterium]
MFATLGAPAQVSVFPLHEVKAGQRGIGKTVFSGDKIEEFQVEVLGVLENIGPRQSLILARLSGGPLEKTGVLQGMSGSPVYIDGRLVGAVAMAFPFSKEPVAGIRPIEEMLSVATDAQPVRTAARIQWTDKDLTRVFPRAQETLFGETRLADVATPVSFAGFTRETLDHFAPQLRALGLEPRQGVSGGSAVSAQMGDPSKLQPGSMISVQLLTGDMSVGADGTVTHIDGGKIYAFGHRFLSIGSTELPFARAEVMTLLPVLSTSFKISTARELMGAISQDRSTAIAGELGRRAAMVPVSISVARGPKTGYQMQMVNNRFLAPLLLQMAIFSSIDATERTVGPSTVAVRGEIEFQNQPKPIKLDNLYAADNGSAIQVSLSTAIALAYVMQSGFDKLELKRVAIEIESFDEKKQLRIDQVYAGRREVRPGEKVPLTVVLAGDNGVEQSHNLEYTVPIGASVGPLCFTVADGANTNFMELGRIIGSSPRTPEQLISVVNSLRGNTRAYVRVWRPNENFQLDGEEFPSPPASLSLILTGSQAGQTRNSKIGEMEIDAKDMVVSGVKTIQVEVKE